MTHQATAKLGWAWCTLRPESGMPALPWHLAGLPVASDGMGTESGRLPLKAPGCSVPRTSPRPAAAHTRSCCPPRCRREGSRCPPSPPPWSRSWSGCRGGALGPGPAPGWAAGGARGSPPPPHACAPPGSPAPAGWTRCTAGCAPETPAETETRASHLQGADQGRVSVQGHTPCAPPQTPEEAPFIISFIRKVKGRVSCK